MENKAIFQLEVEVEVKAWQKQFQYTQMANDQNENYCVAEPGWRKVLQIDQQIWSYTKLCNHHLLQYPIYLPSAQMLG